jgi:hypothetical protein
VFYPLIVLWSITLPSDHVPKATVVDPCLKDLGDFPPLVSVCPKDRQQLIVPRVARGWVRFHELKLDHQKYWVELGVAQWKLELVHTLSHDLHNLEGSEPLVRELG